MLYEFTHLTVGPLKGNAKFLHVLHYNPHGGGKIAKDHGLREERCGI